MAKAANIDAIARTSGRSWDEWRALLEARGGAALTHPQLAEVAAESLREAGVGNPEWWAQGVAVAYEQEIGRRKPGQRGNGTFEFSVSKTFGRDLDHAAEVWGEVASSAAPYRGIELAAAPSVSGSEKWRYWRASLVDGTKLEVVIGARANGATFAALSHTGFASDDDFPAWKAYWKGLLGQAASLASE